MTVIEITGRGEQKGITEIYRDREYKIDLLPKLEINIVVSDDEADRIVETIAKAARTGEIGNGKIYDAGRRGRLDSDRRTWPRRDLSGTDRG